MRSGDGLRSCAWTCGSLALLAALAVAAIVAVGGWYLFRDGAPRPEERFLTGSETHYVSLRLRPDDEGMRRLALAAFARVESTFFVGPATPSWLRSGRTEGWLDMLPATVEWVGDPGAHGAVRIRFEGSHASARALFRILRWAASATNRVPGAPRALEVGEGVPAILLPLREEGQLDLAFVGNRLIASRDEGRLEEILRRPPLEADAPSAESRAVRPAFPREDGWGWTRADDLGAACRIIFSLHLETEDLLAFRAGPEAGCPRATHALERSELAEIVRAEIGRIADGAGLSLVERPDVTWGEDEGWVVSGRVGGLSERSLAAIPEVAIPPGAYGDAEAGR